MHVVPFNDFLTFLDEWWQTAGGADASSVKIYANYMGFPRCCPGVGQACSQKDLEAAVPMQKDWRIPYCCQDEHLYSLIGVPRLHDHSQGQWEGAYRNHRNDHWSDVKKEFAAKYYDWMDSHVDLVLCGHPIFWCTLFEDLLRANHKKSMIAVYDQPPFFLVPEDGEDDFAEHLQALADPEFRNAVVVGQLWLKVKRRHKEFCHQSGDCGQHTGRAVIAFGGISPVGHGLCLVAPGP